LTLLYLVMQGIRGRRFRSTLICLFITVLTGFLMITTLMIRGVESSLRKGMEKLGADIVMVPYAYGQEMQTAVLAGMPVIKSLIPAIQVETAKRMKEVALVSPQLYLGSVTGTPYCAAGEMYVFAFDPDTDFTVLPWLRGKLKTPLGDNEAIGGKFVSLPPNTPYIELGGHKLNLKGKLDPTGIWLDQALFVTLETGVKLIEESAIKSAIPPGKARDFVSTISIKLKRGYSIDTTATKVMMATGAWPVRSPTLPRLLESQRAGLIQSLLIALGVIWGLAVVLSGLVFSLIVGERRREIGMLRAVGASRNFIFRLFITESALLAVIGGVAGIIASLLFIFALQSWLIATLELPFLFPALPSLIAFMIGSLLIALALALPALLYPAIRASRLDPSVAMREV